MGGFERVGTSACSLYRNPPLLHLLLQGRKMTIFEVNKQISLVSGENERVLHDHSIV